MRLARRLLVGLAIAVGLVLLVAVAAPVLVPDDFLKREIAALVREKTGRELRIAGPVGFSLLPNLAFTASDAALSNAAGGVAANLLELKALDVSIRLLPLLRGRVEATAVKLTAPRLSLEIDADGRRNWLFRAAAKPGPAGSGGGGDFFSLASAHLAVVDGRVSYLDRRGGRKWAVADIGLAMALPSRTGPLDARGSAAWNGDAVTFSLAAASPDNLRHGGSSAAALHLASAGASIDFRGDIAAGRPIKATGALDLKIPSLRHLLAWWGVRVPEHVAGLGPLSAAGRVAIDAPKFSIEDAAIALDGIAAKGRLSLDGAGGRPVLAGHLDVDRLDLDPYVAARDAAPSPAAAAPKPTGPGSTSPQPPAGPSSAPLELAPLTAVDADLGISANSIRLRGFDSQKSALALRLKAGRLDVDIVGMSLYGGRGAGTITLDAGGAKPAFAAKLSLTGVEVGPLVHAVSGLDRISGKGDLVFDLAAKGGDPRELVSSLAGGGRVNLGDGELTGFVANPFAAGATIGGAEEAAKELRYSALSGSYTIANGTLKNTDLKVTAPGLSATGEGVVQLSPCRVEYRWLPIITGKGNADIAITGPCDNPVYRAKSLTITKGALAQKPRK